MSLDPALLSDDRQAREDALDVSRSFIVQAPAGSGKTELLIQRYLRLLATVDKPEEILAITFTRKAAAEMRLRVVQALQRAESGETPTKRHLQRTAAAATAVLARDTDRGWQLVTHSRRMRIQTLDALNASIARMQPLTQTSAGTVSAVAEESDLSALYVEAAAATLDWLGDNGDKGAATEEVLLHVDNNTGRYLDYLSRMLKTRDQWLPFVSSGLATAEESQRLRVALEQSLKHVVADQLSLLGQSVPLDAAAEFMALGVYAAQNLTADGKADDPICAIGQSPQLPTEAMLKSPDGVQSSLETWRGIAELLLTKSGGVRKQVNKNQGFPPGDAGQKQAMKDLLLSLIDETAFIARLQDARLLPPVCYSDEQWSVLLALFRLLPVAVAEFRRLCLSRGVTDHIEIALSASKALGSAEAPGDIALLLDYQVRHILVDEMQDTSKAQYRMLEALTGGWQPGDGRTLFCVGDPMQSIYRFRNAEVAQFLLAREKGIGSVRLEPLLLRRNFRSGEKLVAWYNRVFPEVLPKQDDPVNGAVAYSQAVAVEEHQGEGEYHAYPLFGGSVDAEADTGRDIIRDVSQRHPDDSIAVLVRSRTQLPTLLAKLRESGIAYQAVDIDRLSDLPEIIDVLALTRALAHVGDRVAWLGLLRSPWVGLDWSDLHRLVKDAPHAAVLGLLNDKVRVRALSDYGKHAVEGFLSVIEPYLSIDRSSPLHTRVEKAWFALGGPVLMEDINAVSHVYDFIESLSKLETGGTIADVAELMNVLDVERVSTSVAAPVQIMTMHKAKGLQFDHVVLYGLGRYPSGSRKSVLSWFDLPDEHGGEDKIISPIGRQDELEYDALHQFIERTRTAKDAHEKGRLLYVACTRARKSLHLIGNVGVTADGDEFRPPYKSSLLKLLWAVVEPEYVRAFDSAQLHFIREDGDPFVEPPLRRFVKEWQVPDVRPLPNQRSGNIGADDGQRVDYDWVGLDARLAGTVAHRWLQMIADGRIDLGPDTVANTRSTSRRWLRELGAGESILDSICERVESALLGIVSDDKGRWLLGGDGEAELPLAGVVDGRIESIIIDRVRIDDDGTHWIVDYKTSSHEGGNLEGFLRAESDRYRGQLGKYATIYHAYSGHSARCALYFPLLQRFVEVAV
ncbi:MAG: UvrD-helicase domain-containing protein [Gammaproteobacteria bacterium]|nr:UvrD-helicase domain-containing protein [Gammaproteobacteria bacterium]